MIPVCYQRVRPGSTKFVKINVIDMQKVNLAKINVCYDRKKRATSKKAASVEIELYLNRKRKYLSTGVSVLPSEWSDRTKRVVKRRDSDELNALIDAWIKKVTSVTTKMFEDGIADLDTAVALIGNVKSGCSTFIEYCERRRDERNVRDSTRQRYSVFIRFLKEWGKIVTFSDCNVSNVRTMNEFLQRKGYKDSTIYDYNKFLKLFINDAIIDEYIDKNPYARLPFKIKRGDNTYVDCLTEEQFNSLKNLKVKTPHIEQAKDLFLFQCYTGLPYSDLMKFDYEDCVRETNGKLMYHSCRQKTKIDFFFQLITPALEILKKYDYKLPKLSNQKYNDYLKVIGAMIGVERLHTHMGRGTAATMFLSKGMSINVVQKVLGHTSLRQTIRYARTLNKDIKGAFDDLEDKF